MAAWIDEVDGVEDAVVGQHLEAVGFRMFLVGQQLLVTLYLERDVLDVGRGSRIASH